MSKCRANAKASLRSSRAITARPSSKGILSRALDAQKAEANVMSQKMIEYNILKREAEANKTLYDSLQTKLKEGQIASGLKSSNIRIVDPALVPTTPARPAKGRNL